MLRFQPEEMFRILERHHVRYVLLGGLAARLHGSPLRSGEADICPARDPQNLERLAEALTEMEADLRTPEPSDAFGLACDATVLGQVDPLLLNTRFGGLTLRFRPKGTGGYADLVERAEPYDLDGIVVPAPSLEDLVRSREAGDHPKDRAALAALRRLVAAKRRRS